MFSNELFDMHPHEFKEIGLGEVVIFCSEQMPRKLEDYSIINKFKFAVRVVATDNSALHDVAVARRPLLLMPERKAYVCMPIFSNELDVDALVDSLRNCVDQDAKDVEWTLPHHLIEFGESCALSMPSACIAPDDSDDYLSLLNEDLSGDADLGDSVDVKRRSRLFSANSLFESADKTYPTPVSKESSASKRSASKRSATKISASKNERRKTRRNYEEEAIDHELKFDQKAWLDRLSALILEYVTINHAMPPKEIIDTIIKGKLQIGNDSMSVSPLVVNADMRIILPTYNELELRMTPLARTVYILFLCHPEGIVLKNIGEYREQLRDIYLLVKPGADSSLADEYIEDLTYPGSDSLQQKLSLIKRSIKRYLIPETLAEPYFIKGKRGEGYRINLDKSQITLPRALCE